MVGMSGPVPVPAAKYRADKADVMDMAMSNHLCSLDAASLAALWLRRVSPGKYEVDGRRITLQWRSARSSDVIVHEEGISAEAHMPLGDYLTQAANVAKLRTVPGPNLGTRSAVAESRSADEMESQPEVQSPQNDSDKIRSVWSDVGAEDRIKSMHRACQEAHLDLKFTV